MVTYIVFELHKQQHEATTNTSTLVLGRTWFAVSKTEREVVEARKISVPKKTYTKFIFNNIHELAFLYTLYSMCYMLLIFNSVIV